jgi:NAD+ kinase
MAVRGAGPYPSPVPRIVLVVKRTVFARGGAAARMARRGDPTARRLHGADREHGRTLAAVRQALRERGLRAEEMAADELPARGGRLARADLVISIGGDGTLLAASHYVATGALLGVNSAPGDSIGHFCSTRRAVFAATLDAVLEGRLRPVELARLALRIDGRLLREPALNDVLVAHPVPAATTRYRLTVGRRTEEHRSSGLWISTAAGSTAGIRSAGGRVMPRGSRRLQYLVRELLREPGRRYRLARGFVAPPAGLTASSKMPEGRFWIDGARTVYPFPFGARLYVDTSAPPLRLFPPVRVVSRP